MGMGAFKSTILPLISTFAMVATTPSVVLAGSGRNTLDGGAQGIIFCKEYSETNTGVIWRVSADDPSKPIRFVNLEVTTNNGPRETFFFFVPSRTGQPAVARDVTFDNDPDSVNLTGFLSGIGYRYIINPARQITATCD